MRHVISTDLAVEPGRLRQTNARAHNFSHRLTSGNAAPTAAPGTRETNNTMLAHKVGTHRTTCTASGAGGPGTTHERTPPPKPQRAVVLSAHRREREAEPRLPAAARRTGSGGLVRLVERGAVREKDARARLERATPTSSAAPAESSTSPPPCPPSRQRRRRRARRVAQSPPRHSRQRDS